MRMNLSWPLMENNITRKDLNEVIRYLRQEDPLLTHGRKVRAFEEEWSRWLGVKYSVMVNSGSSANLLTITALRELRGEGEIIVPTLTWVSDIASVLQCGFSPVFVDINPRTLGMDVEQILLRLTRRTKAVFLTHVLGFNALNKKLLDELQARNVLLIEDTCESHGAAFGGRKLGAWGWASNFSFYYAHHLSTIEGGMICTNEPELYEMVRMLRSHGLVREAHSCSVRNSYARRYPDLPTDFIFAFPAYNVRPTEISAILGRSQLKRLDRNNRIRSSNLIYFLSQLDSKKYRTDFSCKGCSNYALPLVLSEPDPRLWQRVEAVLRRCGVEFRRGLSGGGNQLRQPYLRRLFNLAPSEYPNTEHIHFFSCYIGNYPSLQKEKIGRLCKILNSL